MALTKEDIYKTEHDLLKEVLTLVWEVESLEEKASVAYNAAGVHDMATDLLRKLEEEDE